MPTQHLFYHSCGSSTLRFPTCKESKSKHECFQTSHVEWIFLTSIFQKKQHKNRMQLTIKSKHDVFSDVAEACCTFTSIWLIIVLWCGICCTFTSIWLIYCILIWELFVHSHISDIYCTLMWKLVVHSQVFDFHTVLHYN